METATLPELDAAARRELAADHLALARKLARPFKLAHPTDRDEYESAAGMALVKAANAYDPSRGAKFATFARHCIVGALIDVRRRGRPIGLQAGDVALSLVPSAAEPTGRAAELADEVARMLRKLPPRLAAACRALYVDGMTQAEAAAELGYSKAGMSKMVRLALDLLRESARVA